MKKIMCLIMIMAIALTLIAQAHDHSEYDIYYEYQENPTNENFIKAYQYYSAQDTEMSSILLAYLHYSQLDMTIENISVNLDSLDTKTKFSYANLLLDLKRYEESVEVYDKLNAVSPQWACPWRHKGEALWKMGNLQDAEAALQTSIEVRKNHYDAYVMLAEVQKDAGKYKIALKTLEEGLQYREENPEYSEDNEFEQSVQKLHQELLQLNN